MLHLAQVIENPLSGRLELQLLARQRSELIWQVSNIQSIPFSQEWFYQKGVLVLVELGESQEIITIEEAKDWILTLIQKYLSSGAITADFVQQEEARVEQWRQEITVQSLELTRKQLEIETQRDQLQELEDSLKQEKEKLDLRWQQLQKLQQELEAERETLKATQQSKLNETRENERQISQKSQ